MKRTFLILAASLVISVSFAQTAQKLILTDKNTSSKLLSELKLPVHYAWNNDLIISANDEQLKIFSDKGISYNIIDTAAFSDDYFIIASLNPAKLLDNITLQNVIYSNAYLAVVKLFPINKEILFSNGFEITKMNISKHPYTEANKKIKYDTGPVLDSVIDTCLAAIRSDSIHSYLQSLENFGTRFCLADNHRVVAVWLQDKFISMGYANTVLDSFFISEQWPWSGGQIYNMYAYNVVATLYGSETPDEVFIAGGHYDDIVYPNGDPLITAPGADDNGTAIAATLEIARVFSENNIQPKSTIKFIAFGAEELGLLGSSHYANEAFSNGENIQMMINCDMIGTNTELPGSWHIRLQNYSGCENETSLAKYICQNYTSLSTVDANNNSSGSDSYSFWSYGFPAIFLQEYEFSPVYHTVNDLVVNIDPAYCAEITKVACGMLLQSIESPVQIEGLVVSDAGDGTSLSAIWQQSAEMDIAGYRVNAGVASGTYDTSYVTGDTTFLITELIEGTEYFIGVSAFDTDGNEGMVIEATGVPLSVPRTPVGLEQLVTAADIKLGWRKNQELDLSGYNIFKSNSPGGTFTMVNITPVTDTTYTDNTVSDHIFYYYKVSAADSNLNESLPSDAIKTRTITHDMGILIVDDSEGGWLNPTDQQVDDFYNNLLINFTHDNYDAFDSTKISIADLGAYSTLLWHINRKVNKPVFLKNQAEVKKFLESGGNLLFTVYEPQGATQDISSYPYLYNPGDFIYDYLKIAYSDETIQGLFIGATPFTAGYDSIYIDTLKTISGNDFHVNGIESIDPNVEGSTIFRYDSYYSISIPAGSMKGKSVGVEYLGSDYKTITISFPLYFMKYNEAKSFIDFVMQQKFGEIMDIDEQQNITEAFSLSIYPNPANDIMAVNIFSEEDTDVSFEIYTMTGQIMNGYSFYCSKGQQQKYMDVTHLPAGFYVLRVESGNNFAARKLIIAK
ncbi:MAG: M20/M25/M40 family metallo-hydrolase [Bacteroidota bacterium]